MIWLPAELGSPGFPDSYEVLKKRFNARYVFLAKPFDDSLYLRLSADPRFSLRKENQYSVVFEVMKKYSWKVLVNSRSEEYQDLSLDWSWFFIPC